MRAVSITGPCQLEVIEVNRPAVASPSDAVVMVSTAGLGPLDIERFRTGDGSVIPGGEFCGSVVEVGADVKSVDIDDLVFGTTAVAGEPERLFGQHLDGGHAEYVLVPNADASLVKTNAASEERSLLAGGSLGLGARGAEIARQRLSAGGTITVVGCDPCGMSALAWLQKEKIDGIQAIDNHPARSTLAKGYGATLLDNVNGNYEADVVVAGDLADGPGIESVAAAVKPGGTVVFCRPGESAEWGSRLAESGVRCFDAQWPDHDFATAVARAIHMRRLNLISVVSHVVPLDDALDAYEAAGSLAQGVQKVLLKP